MSQLLNRVQPGELITANTWNLAVDAINQLLLSRPAAGVTITAMSPAGSSDDPIVVGTFLQIVGQNFGYSSGTTKVIFEGPFGHVDVTLGQLLTGSSDSRLLFVVPSIPTMTPAGMTLTLRVDSGVSQDTRSVLVKPVVISLIGDMFVSLRTDVTPNPAPNPVRASAFAIERADFALKLQSDLNIAGTFALSADIKDATVAVPAGLVDSIQFLDANGSVISNKSVDVATQETRNITVRIPSVPGTFANQTFTLEVKATAPGVTGTFAKTITVGTLITPPDPNITMNKTGVGVFDPSGNPDVDPTHATLDGFTIKARKGFTVTVFYNLTLATGDNYDVTIEPKANTTLDQWGQKLVQTTAVITGPATDKPVKFSVKPSATATPSQSGTLVFRVKKQGANNEWSQEFPVALLP